MKPVLDAYVPSAPGVLANDYDPDFGVALGSSTPATRLLAELVKGALHDARPGAGRVARAEAWAWLQDATGVDDYGTAAFCFDRLGINRVGFLARLHAGEIGTLWHLRSRGHPYRMRQTRVRAERTRRKDTAA